MGLKKEFREIVRREVPGAFTEKPPRGRRFDAACCDFEQRIFRVPPGVRTRAGVAETCVKHLMDLVDIMEDSLRDVFPRKTTPILYALFDTGRYVTAAKRPCQDKRYKHGREAPKNCDVYVKDYVEGRIIACDWQPFVNYPAARRAVLTCLAADLSARASAFDGRAVLIVDSDDVKTELEVAPGIGESENKAQHIALTHEGAGVLIDSSDTDVLAGWMLCGHMCQLPASTAASASSTPRYACDVCMRADVGGGRRTMSWLELVAATALARGCSDAEAGEFLVSAGIPKGTRASDMPDGTPTLPAMRIEYADMNMVHAELSKHQRYRAASLGALGLLCGSDLVQGEYASPLPNLGAQKILDFYLDNYNTIRDLVRYEVDSPTHQTLAVSTRAFWTLVRLVYWSKMRSRVKGSDHVDGVPSYALLRGRSAETVKSQARVMASIKALAVIFANWRYAVAYYGADSPGDALATSPSTGLSIHGWRNTNGLIAKLALQTDAEIEDGTADEEPLHDQDAIAAWASAYIPWRGSPPPFSLRKPTTSRRKASSSSSSSSTPAAIQGARPCLVSKKGADDPMWNDILVDSDEGNNDEDADDADDDPTPPPFKIPRVIPKAKPKEPEVSDVVDVVDVKGKSVLPRYDAPLKASSPVVMSVDDQDPTPPPSKVEVPKDTPPSPSSSSSPCSKNSPVSQSPTATTPSTTTTTSTIVKTAPAKSEDAADKAKTVDAAVPKWFSKTPKKRAKKRST